MRFERKEDRFECEEVHFEREEGRFNELEELEKEEKEIMSRGKRLKEGQIVILILVEEAYLQSYFFSCCCSSADRQKMNRQSEVMAKFSGNIISFLSAQIVRQDTCWRLVLGAWRDNKLAKAAHIGPKVFDYNEPAYFFQNGGCCSDERTQLSGLEACHRRGV